MPRMFQVPPPRIEGRKERVRALFAATRGDDLARALADLPPVYLYVDEGLPGPVEAVRELEARGALREVHRSGRFRLTELVRPPGPAAGR